MAREADSSTKLLLLFGAASLLAVGLGAAICALSDVPTGLWARNLAAWLVGAVAATAIARSGSRLLPLATWAAPLALAAPFASTGQDGVHRWINAGPLSLNAAMLFAPAAVVALAAGWRSPWTWAAALACVGLLVLQPDASQATALGAAVALVAAVRAPGPRAKVALLAACGVLVVLAWMRPDPLQPVREVEEILGLAFAISPFLAGLALAAVVAAALAGPICARSEPPDVRLAGMAVGLCLILWVAAPFLGAFPVPLVGIGLTPILGAWIGLGLLAGVMRARP